MNEADVNLSKFIDVGNILEKRRIEVGLSIEQIAQKLKIENERSLLEQGRTTTYQILLFEQEYFRSQIKSLEIARQLLSLNAEAKSYKF